MGKLTISTGPFSIAMLDYQRVYYGIFISILSPDFWLNHLKGELVHHVGHDISHSTRLELLNIPSRQKVLGVQLIQEKIMEKLDQV